MSAEVHRVLVGVTGGIAAYKACELIRLLVRAGYEVTPIPTRAATRFVTSRTFEALARRERPRELYPHLVEADLLVVAPLTANTLARLAHGLADDVLGQTALAFRGPLIAAPAMNVRMWEHPATQENVRLLLERGVELLGPELGELAEGEVGLGRMVEPERIAERCGELLADRARSALRDRRVLIAAGGTREPIDAVRFVGNRSSGKMGVALASVARDRGAQVTLVYANGAEPAPSGVELVRVGTVDELERELAARADADIVLMPAAVSDYRPSETVAQKRPKSSQAWHLELVPTQDVLTELGRRRAPGQVIVGFAAETGAGGVARAREKLASKGADLIVLNDVAREGIGFEADENELTLITARGERHVSRRSKRACAAAILDEVAELIGELRAPLPRG